MKIPLSWLNNYIELVATGEQIAEKLSLQGLESEYLDGIISVEITPNRGDCLSLLGILRELSVAYDTEYKMPEILYESNFTSEVKVKIEHEMVSKFSMVEVRELTFIESPKEIVEILQANDINSINIVVDLVNYVMLELGQPMHAYCGNSLSKDIQVIASPGAQAVLLNNSTLLTTEHDILVTEEDRILSLAGIMGSLQDVVKLSSGSIVIESGVFEPGVIRASSKRHKLKSDSSYRFERGVDDKQSNNALKRVCQLLKKYCKASVGSIVEARNSSKLTTNNKSISLKYSTINKKIGMGIDPKVVNKILKALDFRVEVNADSMILFPPGFRHDLDSDIDVIEEILRIYGIDKIPKKEFPGLLNTTVSDSNYAHCNKIKSFLLSCGYQQQINFVFSDVEGEHEILNPINKEEKYLRSSLVPDLIKNLNTNLVRGQDVFKCFEIAKVFPSQKYMASGVISSNNKDFWQQSLRDHKYSFFSLKGEIEQLLSRLNISYSIEPTEEANYHNGQAANILLEGKAVGVFGLLHPKFLQGLGLKQKIFAFELFIEELGQNLNRNILMPSKYQAVTRDLNIIVNKDISWFKLIDSIRTLGNNVIKDISLVDIYQDPSFAKGLESKTLRITLQSDSGTLTDATIDRCMDEIFAKLKSEYDVAKRV